MLPGNEPELRRAFLEEADRIPGGELVHRCIQCGTCSGSCPVSYAMDYSPRQVLAMFRAGAIEPLLESRTLWLCASCYQCTTRCPSGIKITDLLYALKRVAIEKGILPERFPVYVLSGTFVSQVRRYGRNFETGLLVTFYLRTEPGRLLRSLGDGWALWRHGRMPLGPRKIRGIRGLRRIIAKAETFDRPQTPLDSRTSTDEVGYRAIGMRRRTVHAA
jgi:heterodisulfide reductase subunit C